MSDEADGKERPACVIRLPQDPKNSRDVHVRANGVAYSLESDLTMAAGEVVETRMSQAGQWGVHQTTGCSRHAWFTTCTGGSSSVQCGTDQLVYDQSRVLSNTVEQRRLALTQEMDTDEVEARGGRAGAVDLQGEAEFVEGVGDV
jgi:hypothetical protein